MTKINFNTFKEGKAEGLVCVANISEELTSVTGNKYVNVMFLGEEGSSKTSSLFYSKEEIENVIPVKTVLNAEFCYKNGFLNMVRSTIVTNVTYKDFIVTSPIPPETCIERIIKTCEILKNSEYGNSSEITLYDLVKEVILEHKDMISITPGSATNHHTYIGGLAYHMYKNMMISFKILGIEGIDGKSVYDVDKEVVITAAILCNINKIFTITSGELSFENNDFYFLRNICELNVDIVEAIRAKNNQIINPKKLESLYICLRSFLGRRNWGSAINCVTEESYIVSLINEFDCNMSLYEKKKAQTPKGTISDYDVELHTRIYNI